MLLFTWDDMFIHFFLDSWGCCDKAWQTEEVSMAARSFHGPRASRSRWCPATASQGAGKHMLQEAHFAIGWQPWMCPGLEKASSWFLFDPPTVSLSGLMPPKEQQSATSGHTLRQHEVFRTNNTLPEWCKVTFWTVQRMQIWLGHNTTSISATVL